MLTPYLLLAMPQAAELSVDTVLSRYETAHYVLPTFEATYEFSLNGGRVGDCRLIMEGGKRSNLRVQKGGNLYLANVTPANGVQELETESRTYDLQPYWGSSALPESRLSISSFAFPLFLLRKSLRQLLPEQAQFSLKGREGSSDVLAAKFSPMANQNVVYEVAVAPDGSVTRLHFSSTGDSGNTNRTWKFRSYRRRTVSDADFKFAIPAGYTPFAVSTTYIPFEVGSKFPMDGWSQGGKSVSLGDLARGKPLLVAIVDAEGPSQAARTSITKLSSSVGSALISNDPSLTGAEYLSAPDVEAKIGAPAAPLFALVMPDGTIRKLWMGYDAGKASSFEQEVLAALNAKED